MNVAVNKLLPEQLYVNYLRTIANQAFTKREVDVLACLCGGRSVKSTAGLLNIAPSTVDNHTTNIRNKLGCVSKEAIREFIEKSSEVQLIKRYYHHLLLQPELKKALNACRQIMEPQDCKCLLIYGSNLPDKASWLYPLKAHLSQTEIQVKEHVWHAESSIDVHKLEDITHVLCLMPKAQTSENAHKVIKKTATNLATIESSRQQIPTSIPMMVIDESEDIDTATINHVQSIALDESQSYYDILFDLIQSFYTDETHLKKLESIQQGFEKRYQSLMSDSITVSSSSTALIAPMKESTRWRWLGIGLLTLSLVASLSSWWYGIFTPPQPPSITWNLPPLMSYYTERKDLTQAIWDRLKPSTSKATATLAGLRGMGGVGKTTLALEAIHYPKQHYTFRGWFKAETEDLLKSDYLSLGEDQRITTKDMSEEQKLRAVKTWLESQPSTLLVYDNAPDYKTIQDYLPNRGHLIITSRNQNMPGAIDIEGMTQQEAVQLLNTLIPKKLLQTDGYTSQVKALAQKLGYLPLALSQAGAYISENMVNINHYLQLYQEMQSKLLSQQLLPPEDQHEPVYVTWDLNIKQLETTKPGREAISLLDFMAYLYPENIPKELLSEYLFGKIDDDSILQLNEVLYLLNKYSLVKITDRGLSIHRLVQAYRRQRLEKTKTKALLKNSVKALATLEAFNCQDYIFMKSLGPHVKSLIKHGGQSFTAIDQARLNFMMSWIDFCSGNYIQVEHLEKQILPIYHQHYGKDHVEIAAVYHELAYHHRALGKFHQAKTWAEKALLIYKHHYGENHRWTAQVYHNLGFLHRVLGRLEQAKTWFEKALPIYEQHYGKSHILTARLCKGLGWVYTDLGQLEQARIWFEKALPIYKKHYGENHARVAHVYRGLGWVYLNLGQLEQVKTWFEKALLINEQHYGEGHIWTAGVYNGLGCLYQKLGQLEQAKTWFEKTLPIYKQHYGQSHIWTASVYLSLGSVYLSSGQLEQAQAWLEKALPIYKRYYGENHLLNQKLYQNLAQLYKQLGYKEKSQQFLEKAKQAVQTDTVDSDISSAS